MTNQRRASRTVLTGRWALALACLIAVPIEVGSTAQEAVGGGLTKGSKPGKAANFIFAARTDEPFLLLAAAEPTAASDTAKPVDGSTVLSESPTYLRDIQPIFMGKCSRCHNSQARFVYNWLDYRTAFKDRWEIRRRIWDSWKGHYYKESMPIQNSPESLAITEEDRMKIREWVTSGAPRGVAPPVVANRAKKDKIELGRQLFTSICAACHQATGLGVPNTFPPLAGSDYLNADKNRAIKTVINGRQGEVVVNGRKFNNSMPSFPLGNDDIANVLTFVYNSFGNAGLEISPDEVETLRGQPPDEPINPIRTPQAPSAFE
jgi:mono/diheme cytochrome c family protein